MNEIVKFSGGSEAQGIITERVTRVIRSVGECLRLLRPEYPRWKHLIPENPTLEQAREAWKIITSCQIIMRDNGELIMSQVGKNEEIEVISDTEIICKGETYTLERKAGFEDGIGVYYNEGYYPEECDIQGIHSDGIGNEGLTVTFPNGSGMQHSGFGEHTDTPHTKENFFYSGGGPGWSTDDNGVRFYLIDKKTGLPRDWKSVQAMGVFRNYVLNVAHGNMKTLLGDS